MKTHTVFVDIDTQRDFMEPTGALAIHDASAILPNLHRLTEFARAHGIPIIATACAHTLDEDDPEPFPPHCLLGSSGHERSDATAWPGSHIITLGAPLTFKTRPRHVTLHKNRYDLFTHPYASELFARYAENETTFVVYGVATDYCVKAAVDGLRDRGYRTFVVVDAVRPVSTQDEPAVLTEFVNRGAVLTRTERVCTDFQPSVNLSTPA